MQLQIEIVLPPEKAGHGKTRHHHGGEFVSPQIVKIRIELWSPTEAYIFYFDQDGNELNDLMYESLERAIQHVEWEFGIQVNRDTTE